MLVRLFVGPTWMAAEAGGDAEFDTLPAIGHQLAIAGDGRWRVGRVRDVVHRLVAGRGAADVALLIDPLVDGPADGEPLPLRQLDGAAAPGPTVPPPPARNAGVPRSGPWGG